MSASAQARARRGKPAHRGDFTIADYRALPDDGQRYELLDGELVLLNSPRMAHQTVLGNLGALLLAHVRANDLGRVFIAPFDVVLRPRSVCQPDVLFIAKSRLRILTKANLQGAPDLAVEIASPSGRRYDRVAKRKIYARSGVRHLWLIEPEEKALEELVLEPRRGRYRDGGAIDQAHEVFEPAVFSGLELPHSEIFRDVP